MYVYKCLAPEVYRCKRRAFLLTRPCSRYDERKNKRNYSRAAVREPTNMNRVNYGGNDLGSAKNVSGNIIIPTRDDDIARTPTLQSHLSLLSVYGCVRTAI